MKEILKIILESETSTPEAPIWMDGSQIKSRMADHPYCSTKCAAKECSSPQSEGESVCALGLSYYSYKVDDSWLTIYGVLGKKANHSDKTLKKASKGRGYSKELADIWMEKLSRTNRLINEQVEISRSEVLHYFHDPVKWANQIHISAEKIVEKGKGQNFGEKLENSTSETKSLFQAANMLVDSFKLTGIYFNPESARYGEIQNCEIYKLFDKVQAIIFHAEGKKYNKRFKMKGTSYRKISIYESFPIIPLCLIQNALKYSKTAEIDISIEDTPTGTDVSITSEGPHLTDNELIEIFKKGVRGKYANRLHHDGLGIGLYVAQKIAEAHNFKITANSTHQGYERDGMPMATNEFKFSIPAIGVR